MILDPNSAYAVVADFDITFAEAGVTSANTRAIYRVYATLLSYVPGRPINQITSFEAGKGYYVITGSLPLDLTGIIRTGNKVDITLFTGLAQDWYYTSSPITPTGDTTLWVKDAVADTPYTNLKNAAGATAPGISFTATDLKAPFLYLIYTASTDSWAKKVSQVEITSDLLTALTQTQIADIIASVWKYTVSDAAVTVNNVTTKQFDGFLTDLDTSKRITFKIGHIRLRPIIGYTDFDSISVIDLVSANAFGRVLNVDLTTNGFTTVQNGTGAAAVVGDTIDIEYSGGNILIYHNKVLRTTLVVADLVTAGANLANLKFGFALYNAAGNSVPSGTTFASNVGLTETMGVQDAVSGLFRQISSIPTSFNIKTLLKQSDITSAVSRAFTYQVNGSGDVTVTASSSKIWDAFSTSLSTSSQFSLVNSNSRLYLLLGYTDSTHIAAISINATGRFGRVVNIDLTANTFTVVRDTSIAAAAINDVITMIISGDSLILKVNGAPRATLSLSELSGLGANITTKAFGLVAYNATGSDFPAGTVVAKSVGVLAVQDTQSALNSLQGQVSANSAAISSIVAPTLAGLKLAIIGDSISTAQYGGITTEQIWHNVLKAKYGLTTFVNAISGSAIALNGSGVTSFCEDSRWQSLNSVFTPDVILIFGGTNDFGARQVPLGTPDSTDRNTFYGALNYMLAGMCDRYKTSRIYWMLPLHQAGYGFPEKNNTTGLYMQQYIDIIREKCAQFGITIIDTYGSSGLTYYNMTAGGIYSPDGLHPNASGHLRIVQPVDGALLAHELRLTA